MNKNTLPFWLVIVINMNVMIGVGVFINPVPLISLAGSLSGLSYLMTGLIVAPLVLVIAELARINPAVEGGLYSYSKAGIGPRAGMVSAASYFIAKSISEGVIIRVAVVNYLKSIFPFFHQFSDLSLILMILMLFGLLNAFGMRFGSRLQFVFMVLKSVPILFVVVLSSFLFNAEHFSTQFLPQAKNFAYTAPIALYAMMGFETCCSIGHTVKDGSENLSKIIITSFILVVATLSLFQFALYAGIGANPAIISTPLGLFFDLLGAKLPLFGWIGSAVLISFILSSMLGALYGMMQANTWNMFVVARELKPLLREPLHFFTKINRYGVPFGCVILQGLIAFTVAVSPIAIPDIQRLAVFGIVICYFLSVIALFRFYSIKGKEGVSLPKFVAALSLVSCSFIAIQCLKGLI